MNTWIVLLRGINVGGKNKLPMKDLRDTLEGLGYQNVRTYIQSGNCVLDSKDTNANSLALVISNAIEKVFGLTVPTIALTSKEMDKALKSNPYAVTEDHYKTVHFFFLAKPTSNAHTDALETLRDDSENFLLTQDVLYLHAPNGIGRSKFAARAEKCLGVPATARNLRSVTKIVELAAPTLPSR